MAAAGAILVKTMNLLAGKVRRRDHARTRSGGREVHPLAGMRAGIQGLSRIPGSICASPNSMIVHGIPGPYKLERGDIISIDIGVVVDGWVADAAAPFPVGRSAPVARKLLTGHRGVAVAGGRAVPRRATASATSRTRSRSTSRPPASGSSARSSDTASDASMHEEPRSPTTANPAPA